MNQVSALLKAHRSLIVRLFALVIVVVFASTTYLRTHEKDAHKPAQPTSVSDSVRPVARPLPASEATCVPLPEGDTTPPTIPKQLRCGSENGTVPATIRGNRIPIP